MSTPSRTLAAAQFTNAIGDGAYLVTSALYFTRVVGLSPTQVGLGLTLGWAVGFLAGVPLGHFADRRGPRGVAVGLALCTAAAVLGFVLAGTLPLFLAVAALYGASQTGLAAARLALLAGLVDAGGRTRARASLQAAHNAGLAIGAGVGGLALQFDTRAAYLTILLLDACAFLAGAVILRTLPRLAPTLRVVGERRLAVLRDKRFAILTGLNTILMLYMPMLSLVVPLWIAQRTEAPRWMVSAILILNTLSVMLFQVRIARRVNGFSGATRLIRYSGGLMLVSCGVFALSAWPVSTWAAVLVLLTAAGLQVAAEMMQASGTWEIAFGLAPADKQGQYQGFFGMSTAVARMAGPLLLTTLVIGLGAAGWIVLGVLFLAASLAVTPVVSGARHGQGRMTIPNDEILAAHS